MVISFYDKDFKGLQDNASLVVDNKSYSLIRRGVDLDELRCTCEPFVESIQPTFLVVKNDKGNYVYGCLAGIPELTSERKTVITGTDLKSMFKSDVLLDFDIGNFITVKDVFDYIFGEWKTQVNQGSFDCELDYKIYIKQNKENITTSIQAADIELSNLIPNGRGCYNAWDDIFAPYLKYYGLHMTGALNLVENKVIFTIGRSMHRDMNIKLWEHGIYDYGKWIANTSECQGYVLQADTGVYTAGYQWILRSDNIILARDAIAQYDSETEYLKDNLVMLNGTIYKSLLSEIDLPNGEKEKNKSKNPTIETTFWKYYDRDIFPAKRKIVLKETNNSDIYAIEAKKDILERAGETHTQEYHDLQTELLEAQKKQVGLLNEANQEALELLSESMFNEDITLSGIDADFETNFKIWVRRGDETEYKSLPCGELHYDAGSEYVENGVRKIKPKKVQIGYRFTGLQFLF